MTRQADLLNLDLYPEFYYEQPRTEMLKYIPQDAKRILDVGCGYGSFGRLLVEKGLEVWGIEKNETASNIAKKSLTNIITGDLYSVLSSLPPRHFDCIVFNDVLEHLVDPFAILSTVRQNLSLHGVVVVSVPNVRFASVLYRLMIEKNWRYSEWGVMDKTHLRFFTINSLAEAFDQCGYEIRLIEGINATTHRLVHIVKILSLGWLSDCIFPQIAAVAKIKE